MKILAALSGGVDSSLAAALAVEAGHEVFGVHMMLSEAAEAAAAETAIAKYSLAGAEIARGCGSPQDVSDAQLAARLLGIPFEVWDISEDFEELVVADFLAEYRAGRTPNPCVRCNQLIKSREMLRRALPLGFDAVLTGHYARIVDGGLYRARFREKDQSYVLAVMGRAAHERLYLPVGSFESKVAVRQAAAQRGLPMSDKPESFDICFIPDGDTAGFLRRHLGEEPGEIVDAEGQVVGEHRGAYTFTVGQRRGLDIRRPAADGRPRYVLGTDMATNRVFVGAEELLAVRGVSGENPVVLVEEDYPGLHGERELLVQYRAHGRVAPARVFLEGSGAGQPADASASAPGLRVEFAEPQRAIAAGQALVVYDDERALAQVDIATTYR